MHLLAEREGGVASPNPADTGPTAHPALLGMGLARLSFKSGASAVALLPSREAAQPGRRRGASTDSDELRDQVQMWALAEADLLVATSSSAFASAGRSQGATHRRLLGERARDTLASRGGSRDASPKKSYVVAREGTCFPWPGALDGAPMTNVGSRFEDTACWDERTHRCFSWSSSPPHRPPRLVPH